MHKIDVPYSSQYQDVVESAWHKRCCGIACVKMVLDHQKPKHGESIDDLISEGVAIGGYRKYGWEHEALTRLLRNRGIPAYREEFRSNVIDHVRRRSVQGTYTKQLLLHGIEKILSSLQEDKPVIVSVDPYFDENRDTHLIVLTGFDLSEETVPHGFFYNDPQAEVGVKKDHFVDYEKFKKYWRNMALFLS